MSGDTTGTTPSPVACGTAGAAGFGGDIGCTCCADARAAVAVPARVASPCRNERRARFTEASKKDDKPMPSSGSAASGAGRRSIRSEGRGLSWNLVDYRNIRRWEPGLEGEALRPRITRGCGVGRQEAGPVSSMRSRPSFRSHGRRTHPMRRLSTELRPRRHNGVLRCVSARSRKTTRRRPTTGMPTRAKQERVLRVPCAPLPSSLIDSMSHGPNPSDHQSINEI